ncbi:hypothetical protein [Ulvibacter antarcticus]|nr:hypothetical protein [Ulvibacter antarcticus]
MKIQEFENLSNIEKFNATIDVGEFVMCITEGTKKCLLYSISSFFVEEQWCISSKKIEGYKSFTEGKLLDKFTGIILS